MDQASNSVPQGPSDEQLAEFARTMLAVASSQGAVVVEASVCPHCQGFNTHAHLWNETLQCQFENCGQRYASKIPRPPLPGELQACHYNAALSTLMAAHKLMLNSVKPLTKEELDTLPDETQHLIVRNFARFNSEILVRVDALAKQYAELRIDNE